MSKNNKNRKRQTHKKSIKHFPCINCITFPICRTLYKPNIPNTEHKFLLALQTKCNKIEPYLTKTVGNIMLFKTRINKLVLYYRNPNEY